jgi:23S rRNA (uracil1939-C5)-methyltransferase
MQQPAPAATLVVTPVEDVITVHPVTPAQLVTIDKPIYGGSFLARLNGKAMFVPLALAGEQVRVQIAEHKRGYATAEIEEIVVASPERIAPACAHFGACGGCNYQHTGDAEQLRIKESILRETLQRAGVEAPAEIDILSAEPWAYRNRIRLAVDAQGRMGYRSRGSHALIALDQCPIAMPALIEAARAAEPLLLSGASGLHPNEIALFANHDGSEMLMSVIVRSASRAPFESFAQALQQRVPALQGAELVVEFPQQGRKPALFPETVALWGKRSIHYTAAGHSYRVDVGAFFQVNRWLVDALVERVTAGAKGKLAWDLFAGVGLFARVLTESFERVVAVESAPTSSDALASNLHATTGKALLASTADYLQRAPATEKPDLIVVDPPRAGLGPEVTAALSRIAAPSLVYVSCDPATLGRDLKELLSSGYQIEKMAMVDLFPQTFHLETVVHLRNS